MGWEWILKLGMIFLAVLWLVMFFFLPETRFIRDKSSSELAFETEPSLQSDAEVSGTSQYENKADDSANSKMGDADMMRTSTKDVKGSNALNIGYSGYTLWTVFPGTWAEIAEDTIRPFRVIWYPLIFWVCQGLFGIRQRLIVILLYRPE